MSDDGERSSIKPEALATYVRIGHGIALVTRKTLAVFEPANSLLADDLWRLVRSGADLDDVLESLSTSGLRGLGAFALVEIEADGIRVVVRGTAGVDARSSGGDHTIRAGGARTWLERLLPDVTSFALWLEPPDDAPLPFRITEGLVPASMILRSADGGSRLDEHDFGWLRSFQPPRVAQPAFSLREESDENSHAVRPPTHDPFLPPPTSPAMADCARTISIDDLDDDEGGVGGRALPVLPIEASPEVAVDDFDYDALYGLTIARSVQHAAVHRAPVDGDDAHSTAPPASPGGASAIGGTPAGSGEVAGAGQLGDHDGRTMTNAQLNALRSNASGAPGTSLAPPASVVGPTVQALVCAAGHLSPTQAVTCRVCESPLGDVQVTAARPNLGRLRFSNGEIVPLDRPVIIGRKPRLEGSAIGGLPRLLQLDIGNGLSRTHAMVRLSGWDVLLEDLGSANGTVVTLRGRPPRELHPGELVLLEDQAEIDFGKEITAVYEIID